MDKGNGRDVAIALPEELIDALTELGDNSCDVYSTMSRNLQKKDWYYFWGQITADSCEMAGLFLTNAMLDGKKEVTFVFCSPGGDSDATRGLIGMMELAKARGMRIRAIGGGLIASAAFDLFTACSRGFRYAFEATMFMTHSSAGHVEDQKMYDLQRKFDRWTLEKYTDLAPKLIDQFLETGSWWFGPDVAVGYGAADCVLRPGDDIPAEACAPQRLTHDEQCKQRRRAKRRHVKPAVEPLDE
jgi:ATP-dependent protease ClpP protease subunit